MSFCHYWYCKKETDLRCKQCKQAYYCSFAHQKASWLSHRASCREPDKVLDVLAISGLLWKLLEETEHHLDGYVLASTNKNAEKVIQLNLRRGPSSRVDSLDKFISESEETDAGKTTRAYWALLSMAHSFVPNLALYRLLKMAQQRGFTSLSLGEHIYSIANVELVVFRITAHQKVERIMDGEIVPFEAGQYHVAILVGTTIIDLSVGQFWLFDQDTRPFIYVPQKYYETLAGELRILDKEHKEAFLAYCHEKYETDEVTLAANLLTCLGFKVDVERQ